MQEICIEQLNLSTRTYNGLKRCHINFLSQFIDLSPEELYNIKNMGQKSVNELLDIQKKYHDDPSSFENMLITVNNNATLVTNEKFLMIHKAFPETVGRTIAEIHYRDNKDIICPDINIGDMDFSNRTTNVLRRENVHTINELAFKSVDEVMKFKGFGSLSYNEILSFFRENTVVTCVENTEKPISGWKYIYKLVAGKIDNEFPDTDNGVLLNSIKTFLFENGDLFDCDCTEQAEEIVFSEEFKDLITHSEIILNALKERIITSFSNTSEILKFAQMEETIPSFLSGNGMAIRLLDKLIDDRKIEKHKNGYRIRLTYLSEWIETLKDNHKEIFQLRVQGKTLEECGQAVGITRERVRQIISKITKEKRKRCVILREDDMAYWYCEYALNFHQMNEIFSVSRETYNYFTVAYKHGQKPVDDIIDDPMLTDEIFDNLEKYSPTGTILVGDEYLPLRRDILCQKLAKINYSEREASFKKFYELYLDFLRENHLDENKKFLFPSERAFEARLQDSRFIVSKYGHKFRYYPIDEYDSISFVNELHFEKFNNAVIGTQKLFDEYKDIMEEYNIADECELHNFLNKTQDVWNKDNKYGVKIIRMPFLSFGEADRAKQALSLLEQLAPISKDVFFAFYEMEYGVKATTAMGDPTLNELVRFYEHNGYYDMDQPQMTDEECSYMAEVLTEDFYFIEDVKAIFTQKFGKENLDHINPKSYKELGFKVYVEYIIRNTYQSADAYFTNLFTKADILDMNKYDSRFAYRSAYGVLRQLTTNYDLLEFEDKKFIKFSRLAQVDPKITKDLIKKYVSEALACAGEDIFTVKSLQKTGLCSPLDEFGFGSVFYSGIIRQSGLVGYTKAGSTVIFRKTKKEMTLPHFIEFVLNKVKVMDTYDFLHLIEDEYGVIIDRYKLAECIKNTGHHYDSIMEKVYFDKDDYYDEIKMEE